MTRPSIFFWGLAVMVVGCQEPAPSTALVTDSAGVRLTLSADREQVFAEVDSIPLLDLGGPQAEDPEAFFRIEYVRRDSNGRLWVANGQSQDIRIFESNGDHWKTIGGRGEGPSEFRDFRFLGQLPDRRMVFWDRQNARLTMFNEDGSLERTTRFEERDRPAPTGYEVFGDGTILAQFPKYVYAATPGMSLQDTVRLQRLDVETGIAELQVQELGVTWVWLEGYQVPLPFMVNIPFDLRGESVYLANGPEFRVKRIENGKLADIFGIERPPRAVGSDEMEFSRLAPEHMPGARGKVQLEVLEHPLVPEFLPAYDRILTDEEGRTWASLYSVDRSSSLWDVFGPSGSWLGQIRMPQSFVLYGIGSDRVIGVWRDDYNTEHVRVYQLRFIGASAR